MSNNNKTEGVIQWADLLPIDHLWLDSMFKPVLDMALIRKDRILHGDFDLFKTRVGVSARTSYMFRQSMDQSWYDYSHQYWGYDPNHQVWHYIRVNRPEAEGK